MGNLSFNLETCARPNILALQPYRCARDDYKDDGKNTLLDANENAYGPSLVLNGNEKESSSSFLLDNGHSVIASNLNRYPDPHQIDLKHLICQYRQVGSSSSKPLTPANLFVGVGSDEAIDALMRCFCIPSVDKILICPPSYGMYKVSAQINDVTVVQVPLDVTNGAFTLQADQVIEALQQDSKIKLVYLCTPGNPTGQLLDSNTIKSILNADGWNGVVILDEAYVDFSASGSSLAGWVNDYDNLVVMQTLSKGFGLAGIRLGIAFAPPPIALLLNSLKAPYNISAPTSQLAQSAFSEGGLRVLKTNIDNILQQRERMVKELSQIRGIGRRLGGLDANFVLVEVLDKPNGQPCNKAAQRVYEALAESKGIVIRFRGKELGCEGCLRMTVGTKEEVTKLLQKLKEVLVDVHGVNGAI